MVVVGLTGPTGCGKHTVASILSEKYDFIPVNIEERQENEKINRKDALKEVYEMMMKSWKSDMVIVGFESLEELAPFRSRPFFLLISVDAPLSVRWGRKQPTTPLESFVQQDEAIMYGEGGNVASCMESSDGCLFNSSTLEDLQEKIAGLDLKSSEWIRPAWDTYFMRLAFLASSRSNCMKRRVGAIIVHNRRVVSTGYNGTPIGVKNCNEGGCSRCNECEFVMGQALEACVCLHAEANALLEAGRNRCIGSDLYVTLAPCLGCAKLIVQAGIKRVLYESEYDANTDASSVLIKSGVALEKYHSNERVVRLSAIRMHIPL